MAKEGQSEVKKGQASGDKNVGQKGFPLLRKPSVPGYNKASGTPGWVSGPAKRAAGRAK